MTPELLAQLVVEMTWLLLITLFFTIAVNKKLNDKLVPQTIPAPMDDAPDPPVEMLSEMTLFVIIELKHKETPPPAACRESE
jgi:hypothetical protein